MAVAAEAAAEAEEGAEEAQKETTSWDVMRRKASRRKTARWRAIGGEEEGVGEEEGEVEEEERGLVLGIGAAISPHTRACTA